MSATPKELERKKSAERQRKYRANLSPAEVERQRLKSAAYQACRRAAVTEEERLQHRRRSAEARAAKRKALAEWRRAAASEAKDLTDGRQNVADAQEVAIKEGSQVIVAVQLVESQERCAALESQLRVLERTLKTNNADMTLKLEHRQQELAESQRVVGCRTKRIGELEQQIAELEEARAAGQNLKREREKNSEDQVTDLKRKLETATAIFDRLGRERNHFMEHLTRLRIELRLSRSGDVGSKRDTGVVATSARMIKHGTQQDVLL